MSCLFRSRCELHNITTSGLTTFCCRSRLTASTRWRSLLGCHWCSTCARSASRSSMMDWTQTPTTRWHGEGPVTPVPNPFCCCSVDVSNSLLILFLLLRKIIVTSYVEHVLVSIGTISARPLSFYSSHATWLTATSAS